MYSVIFVHLSGKWKVLITGGLNCIRGEMKIQSVEIKGVKSAS